MISPLNFDYCTVNLCPLVYDISTLEKNALSILSTPHNFIFLGQSYFPPTHLNKVFQTTFNDNPQYSKGNSSRDNKLKTGFSKCSLTNTFKDTIMSW